MRERLLPSDPVRFIQDCIRRGRVLWTYHVNMRLAAHARDELGHSDATAARPLQAALASAVTFAVGAVLPIVVSAVVPQALLARLVTASALVLLAVLGAVAARVGGAVMWRGALRVTFWGALAMAVSALVGRLFGATV